MSAGLRSSSDLESYFRPRRNLASRKKAAGWGRHALRRLAAAPGTGESTLSGHALVLQLHFCAAALVVASRGHRLMTTSPS